MKSTRNAKWVATKSTAIVFGATAAIIALIFGTLEFLKWIWTLLSPYVSPGPVILVSVLLVMAALCWTFFYQEEISFQKLQENNNEPTGTPE